MKPRRVAGKLLILTVICLGSACKNRPELRAGDELYGIAQEAIVEVRLGTSTRRAEARRFRVADPLMYSFETAAGSIFERCAGSPRLDTALLPLESIRILEVIETTQSQRIIEKKIEDWIDLEIRDVVEDNEPFRLRLFEKSKSPRRLYARVFGEKSLFVVDAKIASLLEQRCKGP